MYSHISNPKTGRKVSVTGRLGKSILLNYLKVIKGGSTTEMAKQFLNDPTTQENLQKELDRKIVELRGILRSPVTEYIKKLQELINVYDSLQNDNGNKDKIEEVLSKQQDFIKESFSILDTFSVRINEKEKTGEILNY